MLTLGFELPLPLDHDTAITHVTDAFSAEGFRVVTRIDMHETFARALEASFRPYTILGLCNPELAHRALSREPGIAPALEPQAERYRSDQPRNSRDVLRLNGIPNRRPSRNGL